jgi:6-phosphogluconolactonase
MRRRDLLIGTGVAAASAVSIAEGAVQPRPAFLIYASVGARLFGFAIDEGAPGLRQVQGPFSVPEEIQACWQDPVSKRLYVVCSDQNTYRRGRHYLSAFRVAANGALERLGEDVALPSRAIFVTLDRTGRFIVVAHNQPAALTVHAVGADGTVGPSVPQDGGLQFGVYPHQVRFFPSQRAVLAPARGNDATASTPEAPGSLHIFDFAQGRLTGAQVVAPNGGVGFRPRHADFHPSGRWLYLDLESQNQVQTYGVEGDRLSPMPLFTASTLTTGAPRRPGQLTSAIQAHPDGRTLYVANRGVGTVEVNGERVGNGSENTIAVFALNPATGEPTLVQSMDTRAVHARTMDVTPDRRWLVAASVRPARVRVGETVRTLAAGLTLFRIERDGRLAFVAKHDIDPGGDQIFWSGPVLLA